MLDYIKMTLRPRIRFWGVAGSPWEAPRKTKAVDVANRRNRNNNIEKRKVFSMLPVIGQNFK